METDTSKNLRRDSTIAYVHMRRATHSLVRMMMMMMMMMMNCFCGMVEWRKAFSIISSWDHCQRPSTLRISDTSQAGFEHAQNLSSDLVKWSCAVVITTTPQPHMIDRVHLPHACRATVIGRIFTLWIYFIYFIYLLYEFTEGIYFPL